MVNAMPVPSPATCFICCQIDPFQRGAFKAFAQVGIGYSLAADERHRAALRADEEGRANFEMARKGRFILREERSWLEVVAPTRNRAREVAP